MKENGKNINGRKGVKRRKKRKYQIKQESGRKKEKWKKK